MQDEHIAAAFFAGDEAALDAAYRAYGRALFSVARSILGNDQDAQDCVHDALLRVWQRRDRFCPERGALRPYLMACVRNEAITRKRDHSRHARIELVVAQEEPYAYHFEAVDVIERDRLRHALALLPIEQRRALGLAYFHHLTHAEIADRLGEPLGTIKGRLRLALAKLQAAMRPADDAEAGSQRAGRA